MIFSILLFFLSSFTSAKTEELPDDLILLKSQVFDFANSDLMCGATEDCAVLPIGYKACGGPSQYIVASRKSINFETLKLHIKKYLKADQHWQESQNQGSICDVTPKIQVECRKSKCTQIDPLKAFSK